MNLQEEKEKRVEKKKKGLLVTDYLLLFPLMVFRSRSSEQVGWMETRFLSTASTASISEMFSSFAILFISSIITRRLLKNRRSVSPFRHNDPHLSSNSFTAGPPHHPIVHSFHRSCTV
jgi:hypothetical protein